MTLCLLFAHTGKAVQQAAHAPASGIRIAFCRQISAKDGTCVEGSTSEKGSEGRLPTRRTNGVARRNHRCHMKKVEAIIKPFKLDEV
jgi:hypothetical protein